MKPTEILTPKQEARLLGECFALLLADIRRNRAARLAQSGSESNVISSEPDDKP